VIEKKCSTLKQRLISKQLEMFSSATNHGVHRHPPLGEEEREMVERFFNRSCPNPTAAEKAATCLKGLKKTEKGGNLFNHNEEHFERLKICQNEKTCFGK